MQLGYGDRYLSDFLLLDHLCGESHVPARPGVAEVLRQITIEQTSSPKDLITFLRVPFRAELPPGLKDKTAVAYHQNDKISLRPQACRLRRVRTVIGGFMRNERGSVLIFVTLMIVLLLIMVGMGLDTGYLTYSRNMGQSAVDSSALAAVSALPSGDHDQVVSRAAGFNSINDYVGSPNNSIGSANVTYVRYDYDLNQIVEYGAPIGTANGVRVALEATNAISTPAFLTPLFRLFGASAPSNNAVNVSAVATINSKPSIPIALWSGLCPSVDYTVKSDVQIQLQHPTQDEDGENACWTTFKDCSSGAADIKALFNISQTCSPSSSIGGVSLGTEICQNRGQANSSLFEAEEFFTTHDGEWWTVPVIAGGGNCDPQNPTPILNWAQIKPKSYQTTGNPKYIIADVKCGPNLVYQPTGSLCHSHRLVREPSKGY